MIKEEKNDNSDIKIYMDGSGYKGNVGGAAVLYRKGVEEPERVLRFHLGSLKQHTMFEGEVVGSILAAWMLKGRPEVEKLKATSYSDSQVFIKVTGARNSGPEQYLVLEYMRLTQVMNNGTDIPETTGSDKFTLRWIAAHAGVKGNKRVDEEAKRAAQGESSPPEELPPILRKLLPTSAAAAKQEFAEDQKVSWLEMWKTSPHFARFQHIDRAFPFNKFWKISDALSRLQASLLIQLRMGHIPLNSYLHCIKRSDTRHSINCWDAGHRSIIETVIPRGWQNVEKRPTLVFFFSEFRLTPPHLYLPNIVCFSHTHVFFFFLNPKDLRVTSNKLCMGGLPPFDQGCL